MSQSRDKLSLYASGRGGIEELRPHLQGDVFFALIREDRSFILISFVPEDISGVRRGRSGYVFCFGEQCLVLIMQPVLWYTPEPSDHSSRCVINGLFWFSAESLRNCCSQAHHAAWTITKADALTADAIRSKLKLPTNASSPPPPTPSLPLSFPSAQQTNGRQVSSLTELSDGARRLRASEASGIARLSPPTSPNGRRKVNDQISTYSPTSAPSRELPPTVRESNKFQHAR